ncbi:MAG: DNA polymerase IV, partial [bacterium]
PQLKGKPVAVGGSRKRGVVAAASYEARQFGVRSAMASAEAKRRCPSLIFTPPRFDVYRQASKNIRSIFKTHTDLIEPLSLDEAYLDVTQNKKNRLYANNIAREIRAQIKDELNLTASAGISYNKFLAKIASDLNKPDGQAIITPDKALAFLERLKVEKFFGVGKVTAKKMHELGIYTGSDLKSWSEDNLTARFGRAGQHYYQIVRGIDNRKVNPNQQRKSIGVENTYSEDINNFSDQQAALELLCKELLSRCKKVKLFGNTLTVKIRFPEFITPTRSRTYDQPFKDLKQLISAALQLLKAANPNARPVRLLGVTVSHLNQTEKSGNNQLEFPF